MPPAEIIRQTPALLHELLDRIVEHDFVEEMTIKMLGHRVAALVSGLIITSIPKHPELVDSHTHAILRVYRDLPEHICGHKGIKIGQRRVLVTVGHEERGDGT